MDAGKLRTQYQDFLGTTDVQSISRRDWLQPLAGGIQGDLEADFFLRNAKLMMLPASKARVLRQGEDRSPARFPEQGAKLTRQP